MRPVVFQVALSWPEILTDFSLILSLSLHLSSPTFKTHIWNANNTLWGGSKVKLGNKGHHNRTKFRYRLIHSICKALFKKNRTGQTNSVKTHQVIRPSRGQGKINKKNFQRDKKEETLRNGKRTVHKRNHFQRNLAHIIGYILMADKKRGDMFSALPTIVMFQLSNWLNI